MLSSTPAKWLQERAPCRDGSLSPMTASYSRSQPRGPQPAWLTWACPRTPTYLGIRLSSRLLKRYCLTLWLLWRSMIFVAYCLHDSRPERFSTEDSILRMNSKVSLGPSWSWKVVGDLVGQWDDCSVVAERRTAYTGKLGHSLQYR